MLMAGDTRQHRLDSAVSSTLLGQFEEPVSGDVGGADT